MRAPNFFIVGAPKSGTTSLLRYCAAHPDISMPQLKEPVFFGKDLHHSKRVLEPESYAALFSAAANERIIGEKSVWYLFSQSAAREIMEFNPDARIAIMLREPVAAMASLHSQFLWTKNEDLPDLRDALLAQSDRKKGLRIPRTAHFPAGLQYVDVVSYASQVERFLDVFGASRTHVILFNEFQRDTSSVYGRLLEFLGVDSTFRPEFPIHNPRKRIRSQILMRFLDRPPGIYTRFVSEEVRAGLDWRLRSFNKIGQVSKKQSEVPDEIQEQLRQDSARLEALLGRPLDWFD